MAFDISTAKPVGGFDLSTAKPVDEIQPAPAAPVEQTGATFTPRNAGGWGEEQSSMSGTPNTETAMAMVNEFAKTINMDAATALDMLTSVVRAPVDQAAISMGSDFRMPQARNGVEQLSNPEASSLPEGKLKSLVHGAAHGTGMIGGMVSAGPRNLATLQGALPELLGFGSASTATKAPMMLDRVTPGSTAKAEAKLPLLRNQPEEAIAGYKLDPAAPINAPAVIKSPAGRAAKKQNIPDGLIALAQTTTRRGKDAMRRAIQIAREGKTNFRKQAEQRPWDVTGKALADKFRVVYDANREAAGRLKGVARSLKGKYADPRPALDDFLRNLGELDVKVDLQAGKLKFSDSALEGLDGPINVLNRVFRRLYNTNEGRVPDAYDLHRAKIFLDEQISYGKQVEGMTGKVEGVLKQLRRGIDKALDTNFPEYDAVNTKYSQTRKAIDALEQTAGKKVDLLGEDVNTAVGTLSRRLLSNYASRTQLKGALRQLDEAAQTHAGYMVDDDIMGQVIFIDELEKISGAFARTSLQGEVAKAANQAAARVATTGDVTGEAVNMVGKAAHKLFGNHIDENKALDALDALLKE